MTDKELERHSEEKYDTLVEREEELQERIQELRQKKRRKQQQKEDRFALPRRTFITGLIKGEVTDFDISNGKLILDVYTGSEMVKVRIRDRGDYDQNNELARLLEWKNIKDGKIGELIGEKITLKIQQDGPIKKRDSLSEYQWKVYIPNVIDKTGTFWFRLDNVSRRFGITFIEEEMNNRSIDVGLKIMGSLLFFSIALVVIITIFLALSPLMIISPLLYFCLVIVVSLFSPVLMKYIHLSYRNYKESRNSDELV